MWIDVNPTTSKQGLTSQRNSVVAPNEADPAGGITDKTVEALHGGRTCDRHLVHRRSSRQHHAITYETVKALLGGRLVIAVLFIPLLVAICCRAATYCPAAPWQLLLISSILVIVFLKENVACTVNRQ